MNNKHSKELCHSQFQGNEFQGSELYHHGILGMHWGIRRYQPYPDGYKGDGKFTGEKSRSKNKDSIGIPDGYKPYKNLFGNVDNYEKKSTLKSGKPLKVTVASSDSAERQKELFDVANKAEKHKDKLVSKAIDELVNRLYLDYTFDARDIEQTPLSKQQFRKALENDIGLEIIDRKNDNAMVWITVSPTKQSLYEWALPSAVFDNNLTFLHTRIDD